MRHTVPLLALANDAAAHVNQSDVLALAALCTVLAKLSSAVADGPRLENLAWRLWHRARTSPASTGPSSVQPSPNVTILAHPVSLPSVSSESSTGTGHTSDTSTPPSLAHQTEHPPTLSPHSRPETYLDAATSSSPVAYNQGDRLLPATALAQTPCQRQQAEQGRMRIRTIALPVPEGWSGRVVDGPLTPSMESDGCAERPVDVRGGGRVVRSVRQGVGASPVSFRTDIPRSPPSVGRLISQLFADPALGRVTQRRASNTLESTSSSALHSGSATSTPRQPFPTLVIVTPTPHPTPPATPSPGAGEADTTFGYVTKTNSNYGPVHMHERDDALAACTLSSQSTATVNGQLATPISINGDMRGNPVVADGNACFFGIYGPAVVEAPTNAVMPAHSDPGSNALEVAPSWSAPALLPAASIGMPSVISLGSTSKPGEGDLRCSEGTLDGELLVSRTDTTASAIVSAPGITSMEASTTASTSTSATSTAPSALSTPATTPVTSIASPPCPSAPTPTAVPIVPANQAPSTIPVLATATVTSLIPLLVPTSTISTTPPVSATPTPPPGTLSLATPSCQSADTASGPTPAPSSAEKKLAPVEDKKFFLAAQRSEGSMGSGVSSESPESDSVGSGSGKSGGSMGMGREVLVGAMGGREALLAKAMVGRVASYGDTDGVGSGAVVSGSGVDGSAKGTTSTSPGDGIRSTAKGKGRAVSSGGSSGLGGKWKNGLKRDEGVVGEVPGGAKGEVKLEIQRKSAERAREPKGKGKEQQAVGVDERGGAGKGTMGSGTGAGLPAQRPGLPATRSLQQLPSHRPHPHGHPHAHANLHGHPHAHANLHGHPHVQPHQSHQLRQLPTNPPRRQHSPARRSALGAASTKSPSSSHGRGNTAGPMQSRSNSSDSPQQRTSNPNSSSHARTHAPPGPDAPTRHLPYHPQLSHLGLGHLPTVPPKQRRPIEITETSSEYETTDTEGDESSWESESLSGEDAGAGGGKGGASTGPSKHGRNAGDATSKNGKAATTSANAHRTRDAGEFARDAALEAQRQRNLFQKLPVRSYSNLTQLPRAKSGLSLLFRPDPELFPEGHPYRTSKSSRDLLARNWSAPAPPLAVTALSKRGSPVGPMSAAVNADPVVASVNSRTSTMGATGGSTDRHSGGLQRGGYRLRGKPADQEEETDSGEDDPDDAIQVSSSVAQRRLAALMGRRGTQSQQQLRHPSSLQATSPSAGSVLANQDTLPSRPPAVSRTTTAPVLMHPYLPDPAPLQTPHTVRRNIISQELDEELRRNLLWERSQNQIQGRPPRAAGSILPGPWRPMTSLRPEEESGESQAQVNEDRAPGRRPFGTQRTKSWAGDFHASGW